jgi:hypothetical protein
MQTQTPSKLQIKASRLLNLDTRRRAHHAALSSLHASPLKDGETHETRGLKMWRKLRRIEAVAHDAATAQCNGEAYNGQPFRSETDGDYGTWDSFVDSIRAQVAAVFGGYEPPLGFFLNGDPRGMALCLDSERVTIPEGMQTNWGGDGILAADITL